MGEMLSCGGFCGAARFDAIPKRHEMDVCHLEEIFTDEKPDRYAFAGERVRKSRAEVIVEFTASQKA